MQFGKELAKPYKQELKLGKKRTK